MNGKVVITQKSAEFINRKRSQRIKCVWRRATSAKSEHIFTHSRPQKHLLIEIPNNFLSSTLWLRTASCAPFVCLIYSSLLEKIYFKEKHTVNSSNNSKTNFCLLFDFRRLLLTATRHRDNLFFVFYFDLNGRKTTNGGKERRELFRRNAQINKTRRQRSYATSTKYFVFFS